MAARGYDLAPSLPALAGAGHTVVEHANASLFLPCCLCFPAASLCASSLSFHPGSTAL